MPDPNLNPIVIRIDNTSRNAVQGRPGGRLTPERIITEEWRRLVRNAMRHAVALNQCYGCRGDYPVVTIFGEERQAGGGNPPTAIITIENLLFNDMSGGE